MPRVAAIVLAAGAGSRFGGGKLRARIDGRPVLQHVLDQLAEAGIEDVVVVLGADAEDIEDTIEWRAERRVRNPDPARGLSTSLRIGVDALAANVDRALIVLGDQPMIPAQALRSVATAQLDDARPIVVPVYSNDRGRNPVGVERTAFPLVAEARGDRGLAPVIAAHRGLVREIHLDGQMSNPDVDTRADLIALLETAWAARVRANADQVDRHREVPDGADFYAPVTSLFRADPTRTDEPVLAALLDLVRPGETWLDIGAGAGRYALPIARSLAPSGGAVVAIDPSDGMLSSLREVAAEHAIENVRIIRGRWPAVSEAQAERLVGDVALIAHVGYDIEAIGPFVAAMERAARRLCLAVLMERQPASVADPCWPPVWGEDRVPLPAFPEFVELLEAMGRDPSILRLEREPRRFTSRDELEGFLRRQLWTEKGSEADRRFLSSLDRLIEVDAEGRVGLAGQRPLPIGVISWSPP